MEKMNEMKAMDYCESGKNDLEQELIKKLRELLDVVHALEQYDTKLIERLNYIFEIWGVTSLEHLSTLLDQEEHELSKITEERDI